jgi:hypothetical protein
MARCILAVKDPRRLFVEAFHVMLPEDEIFLCGAVFLYGVLAGAAFRLVKAWRQRRSA